MGERVPERGGLGPGTLELRVELVEAGRERGGLSAHGGDLVLERGDLGRAGVAALLQRGGDDVANRPIDHAAGGAGEGGDEDVFERHRGPRVRGMGLNTVFGRRGR